MNPAPSILLVEDNPMDLELALRALRQRARLGRIDVARDGEEALGWLSRWEAGEAPPTVVLLDLKLPRVDGLEVLRRFKNHPHSKRIPVVVLTTSAEPADVRAAYDAGVNSYIVKPVDFDKFVAAASQLDQYWNGLNHGPQ